MAKYCSGSVASLAHSDVLLQHIHPSSFPLGRLLQGAGTDGSRALQDQQTRGVCCALAEKAEREAGVRVPGLEGEQVVLLLRGQVIVPSDF